MPLATTLVDVVRRHGADTVFGVPGGGANLDVIGAARAAGLRFVLTHGETAGAIAAATYGLLAGRPALAVATRGPGVTSAANGIAQATLDRFPLVFVADCVPAADTARVAHQRIDQLSLTAPVTKWSGRLGADAAAGATARAAFAVAAAAPRGAVHLDVDPSAPSTGPAGTRSSPTPVASPEVIERAQAMLAASERPVAIVGFGAVGDAIAVRASLELLACPVLTTYQAAGVLPDGHPQLAGSYTGGALEQPLLDAADLVLAVGLDTVEPIPAPWSATVPVLSIDVAPPASSYLPTSLAVEDASIGSTLGRVVGAPAPGWPVGAGARAREVARSTLATVGSARRPGALGPVEVARTVAGRTPPTATATVDAGAHFLAVMPFWPASGPLRLLISNGLATMGFALPAAVGAALARPGTPVVCLVGDGGLGMTLAELETIARLGLPITVVVFDDAALSLIEIKQLPGQGGTDAVRYAPIDFAAVARAVGLDAVTATTVAELEEALDGGWGRPRLVDVRIDPSPYRALLDATRG